VRDLTVKPDVSVDASATVNGGNNTYPNRIAGTVSGTTAWTVPIVTGPAQIPGGSNCGITATLAAPTTVTLHCGASMNLTAINSSRVSTAPITITGAGAAGADYTGTITAIGSFAGNVQTLTVSPGISTAITLAAGTLLNPITPPWYLGNAGFALQCSNSAACARNTSSWRFRNIRIIPITGGTYLQYNHSVGIFSQLALYDGALDNVNILWLYGGYIEAAPTTGAAATPDTMAFNKIDVFGAVLPFITYNGSNRTMNNVSLYASGGVQSMCNFFFNGGQTTSTVATWSINGLYCEGSYTGGEVARWMSGPYKVFSTDYIVGSPVQATIEWLANGSLWDGFVGGNVVVAGNGNVFRNTRLLAARITDNGQNNTFENATISGSNSYMGRKFNPNPRPPRDPVGKFDASFLSGGSGTTPYPNASDLIFTCDDWGMAWNPSIAGAQGTCVTDSAGTETTRQYFQSQAATTTFDLTNGSTAASNAWNGVSRLFGTNVPLTKVTVYVQAQCVGTATCSATGRVRDLTLNSTVGATGALSFTSSWTVQSWTADLSAATIGDVMAPRFDTWTNAGTNYRIAWVAIQPVNVDEHTWLAANGLPTAGGNIQVANTAAARLCTGGSSGFTTGHLITATGTNSACDLQDGGPVPVATQTAVPLWLQFYGDGSEGAYSCPSGTCDLQTGEHYYTTCNITAGAIVDAKSTTLSAGAPLILHCSTSATIAGTISYTINTGSSNGTTAAANYGGGSGGGGFGAANGTIGNGYLAAIGAGTAGTSGNPGGAGTATPAYVQKIFLSSGYPYTGTACGGGAGGAGGSSGGAGGRGAGCIVIISPIINFTGTCDVSGQNGTAGGVNTGGGGGGAGGVCLFRSPSATNSGTFTVTGGTGGPIGSGTGTAGGNGAAGWSKFFSQ
jgi:hypothetical protein